MRVWVPGCATGEEVFSLAMLLREHMDRLTALPRVQIFATDIDERALAVARAARYPGALLDSVSRGAARAVLRRRTAAATSSSKEVRDLCIFSPHSVIRDPPFSRIDLVSCRNLLIYFGLDVQDQVIPMFHYALRPDGYLFLGTSENIGPFGDLFAPVEKKHRIFRRRSDGDVECRGCRWRSAACGWDMRPADAGAGRLPVASLCGRRSRAQVLDRFAPPYVVVNREGEVGYFSARTGKYLEAAHGAPTRQILAMARKGLRLDLRTALREAVETGRAVTRAGVAVEGEDGRVQTITLTVEPLRERDGGEPLYLVLFADQGPTLSREEAANPAAARPDDSALHLERELRETRERLQSMIEEYETALEELKSSNEELVSVNEELQSTNEELEASKEELQSVNEELHTVNAELHGKIEALDRANGDLQNLFESTDIATDIPRPEAGRSAASRRRSRKVFNILPGDRGRPITDLSSRVQPADLRARHRRGPGRRTDRSSAARGQAMARPHYLVRLAPYRNADRQSRGRGGRPSSTSPRLTRAEARQQVLIAELQHRTRNLLAVVASHRPADARQGRARSRPSRPGSPPLAACKP